MISKEAFICPTDKVALQSLERIPLLTMLVRKYNDIAGDRVWRAMNGAESVRCSPTQYATLYEMMVEACAILDVTEPELFLRYSETYNAYTAGMNHTFIVLQSALVDDFTDDELRFIIGHEVGHIKAAHLLYQNIGRNLIPLLDALGQVAFNIPKLVGLGLVSGFFEWMRQAEYSCDRAGLLVCQNPDAAFTALMKMGCGKTRFDGERSVTAFLEQAKNHSETVGLDGAAKALLFLMYNWTLSHPQIVYRTKALDEWFRNGAYNTIMEGKYTLDPTGKTQLGKQVRCNGCKAVYAATTLFCPKCQTSLQSSASATSSETADRCGNCNVPLSGQAAFCPRCSTPTR